MNVRSNVSKVVVVTLAVATLLSVAGCAKRSKKRMRFGKIPEKYKNDGAPKVGDVAPLFALKTLDGDQLVDLKQRVGKRPVALIFGSYT